MTRIRVTKEFSFEMAHALHRYDGKCENIHGHTYHLSVTVIGEPQLTKDEGKSGMVMDFSDLKLIVQESILDRFDHALVLNAKDPRRTSLCEISSKVILTPYQPTSENLIMDFVQSIMSSLPSGVTLHSVKLRETPTSFSEWNASDNV